ncbi:GNAT family N-acetyltransferase [Burkholderia guangdongensis]|uniref:GNAT family N-acetyltransferase n=1 Tax=Burkholderia guangdongensis TaxID=1792500 RepID=UPI0015CB5A5C|nr:GNAT family N-acetyltransferase [Burkholderia guangdongensis]
MTVSATAASEAASKTASQTASQASAQASAQFTPSSAVDALEWRWKPFDALSAREVYAILDARSAVFVVEQQCVYRDIDNADQAAWHLAAYGADGRLAGYLRVLLPDARESDVRIGRVLTTDAFRGIKLGNALLANAIEHIRAQWPGTPVSLHAQAHLQRFYGAFGFTPSSDVHDEDGIPHVWMRAEKV